MKKLILLFAVVLMSGCSESDETPDTTLPQPEAPEISQGLEINVTREGESFPLVLSVCDKWNDLSDYDFSTNIGGFFHKDSLNKVDTETAGFYRFELPEGKYLIHVASGATTSPSFFSLKEFTVERDKVTKLEKNFSNQSLDFSKITAYQRQHGVYIPW